MKESVLKRHILSYLSVCGIFAWNSRTTGVWNAKTGHFIPSQCRGCPDILGVMPGGRIIAIEVKIKGNKPTFLQLGFIEMINSKGGLAFVAYSLDDVETRIKEGK